MTLEKLTVGEVADLAKALGMRPVAVLDALERVRVDDARTAAEGAGQ